MKLSIIFGTYNRFNYLRSCARSIWSGTSPLEGGYEIVVADPGSKDGSREWMDVQGVRIVQDRLEGAVPAFNLAFESCTGDYIALINDDVELLTSDGFKAGITRLEEDPSAGQLAYAFTRTGQPGDAKIEYSHRDKPYANLGMIKRSVAEEVIKITGGIWTPLYRTYGADTELSCWYTGSATRCSKRATSSSGTRSASMSCASSTTGPTARRAKKTASCSGAAGPIRRCCDRSVRIRT